MTFERKGHPSTVILAELFPQNVLFDKTDETGWTDGTGGTGWTVNKKVL